MELKEKLVALRKEKGLTQLAVAEKLDVSRQAISRWESGVALPSTDNLKSLSVLYGVPVDYLLNSDVEREHTQVQTDMHCGEQATPQKMDKRKTKRVIIGLAIFLLVVAVVLALIKERHEFFHLIGICISVSEGISFIKICRNRKNAEMYVDIIGPYRNQFLISQAILFAIGAMIYPITFLMRIEDGLGSAVYLFIISFRRIMLWAYKKRYSVQK